MPRPVEEIKKEIETFENRLEELPDNSPDIGHIGTILIGLRGELMEAEMMSGQGRYVPVGGKGLGPQGDCVCLNCGYTAPHTPDNPCMNQLCPNCGIYLTRR